MPVVGWYGVVPIRSVISLQLENASFNASTERAVSGPVSTCSRLNSALRSASALACVASAPVSRSATHQQALADRPQKWSTS